MRKSLFLFLVLLLAGLALAGFTRSAAAVTLTPDDVSWQMVGSDMVQFKLHFHNDGTMTSGPASGTLYSQEFGAFVPRYGTIGTFDVPPIEPESFFDVFFEVPLSTLPGGGGGGGLRASPLVICPPPMWVGNVDVVWVDENGPAEITAHYGDVGVCPGGPKSCLHVTTDCAGNVTWAIRNVCAGWTVTLENEDHTPAPASIPPGPGHPSWTGWICITANANIPINAQCCFAVDLTCLGVTATINVCAYACECPVPSIRQTWGGLKTIYR
jgi:hypothetical protein